MNITKGYVVEVTGLINFKSNFLQYSVVLTALWVLGKKPKSIKQSSSELDK